jgi:hypothetical protein
MTAIEWFMEQIRNNKFVTASEQIKAIEQAKEMEKQQIIDACRYGNNFEQGDLNCAIYYEKTYKNTKE